MKIQEAIDILKHDNRWKRGEDIKQKKPAIVLEATDTLITFTEKVLGEHRGFFVKGRRGVCEINNDMYKAMINEIKKEVEGE